MWWACAAAFAATWRALDLWKRNSCSQRTDYLALAILAATAALIVVDAIFKSVYKQRRTL